MPYVYTSWDSTQWTDCPALNSTHHVGCPSLPSANSNCDYSQDGEDIQFFGEDIQIEKSERIMSGKDKVLSDT